MSEQIEDPIDEVEVENPPEGVEEQAIAPEKDEDREAVEELARKYGWRPKTEFTRDPEGWVDADKFLTFPTTQVKVLRDQDRDNGRRTKELEDRIARQEAMHQRALDRTRQQEAERWRSEVERIEAQKRAAVEVGDLSEYDRLRKAQESVPLPEPVMPQPRTPAPEVAQYRQTDQGKWMNDPHAFNYAREMIDQNPQVQLLPHIKQVQWAEGQIKQFWPEYFPEPEQKRQTTSRVDAGGMGFRKSGRGTDDLPAEARSAGAMYVKEGLYKSIDEYAKEYWALEN